MRKIKETPWYEVNDLDKARWLLSDLREKIEDEDYDYFSPEAWACQIEFGEAMQGYFNALNFVLSEKGCL